MDDRLLKACVNYPCQDVANYGDLMCPSCTPRDAHDDAEREEADALAEARGGAVST